MSPAGRRMLSKRSAIVPGAIVLVAGERWPLAAFGAVLLGFALRISSAGSQSLWYDEAFSLLMARRDYAGIVQATARDTMPPLYYWLLHAWGSSPAVEFWPRMLSVLAGTLSVALVYAVAARLLGVRAAAGAALVTAVSPFHLFYSQEVRMYALLGVWNLLAAAGFVEGWFRGRGSGWLLYGLGTLLSLYTHALGWLPPAALLAWAVAAALLARRADPKAPPPLLTPSTSYLIPLAAFTAAGLFYLPWAGVVARQAQRVFSTFWAAPPSPLSPLASLYLLFEGPFAGALFPAALAAVLLGLGLTVAPLAAPGREDSAGGKGSRSLWQRARVGAEQAGRPHRAAPTDANLQPPPSPEGDGIPPPLRQALSLLWAWALLPLLGLLGLSLVRSVYLERVVIGAAFPLYMLLGWLLATGRPRLLGAGAGLLIVAAGLWGVYGWTADPAMAKPPYRDAVALVRDGLQPGEVVLHTSDGGYLPFLVYAPDLPNRLLAGDPEAAAGTARAGGTYDALELHAMELEDAVRGAPAFVLVVSLDHSVDYQAALLAAIDGRYHRTGEQRAGGILVRTYATGAAP